MKFNIIFCVFFLFFLVTNAHNILVVFPAPSHSHYTLGYTLSKELAKRGHQVTLLAAYPEKEPIKNLRYLALTEILDEFQGMRNDMNFFNIGQLPTIFGMCQIGGMGTLIVDRTLRNQNVQNLLKSGEKFDAVMVEQFETYGLLSLPYYFNAVPIVISAIAPSTWTNSLIGNLDIPSYITQVWLKSPVHTDFFKRVQNMLVYFVQILYYHLYLYPKQNQIIQQYFPNYPSVYDLAYNTSLILYDSDASYSESIPKLPNMIEIGGIHIQPPKELPEDLQGIMDGAKNGVVYFSLGSNLRSRDLPGYQRDEILRTFSKMKEIVLWKYEDDSLGTPSNVIIRKWFPQSDLLAHPNLKLFITHGGLLSTIESLHRGVPIIGIPVLGDQKLNMANAVNRGYGVMIDYPDLSQESLSAALKETLNNPIYSKNVKRGSQILQGQQTSPADRAEFWIDYVIRHKGAKHLRPASLELTWYQHISLDVMLFLTSVTIVLFVIFYKVIKWLVDKSKSPEKEKRA